MMMPSLVTFLTLPVVVCAWRSSPYTESVAHASDGSTRRRRTCELKTYTKHTSWFAQALPNLLTCHYVWVLLLPSSQGTHTVTFPLTVKPKPVFSILVKNCPPLLINCRLASRRFQRGSWSVLTWQLLRMLRWFGFTSRKNGYTIDMGICYRPKARIQSWFLNTFWGRF